MTGKTYNKKEIKNLPLFYDGSPNETSMKLLQ